MQGIGAAVIVVAALLAGCAAPAPGATVVPTQALVVPIATPGPPTVAPAATRSLRCWTDGVILS